ncbi:hypothetical protein K7432_017312 [Basidiobolus ranarum]|uniref:Uncharacterized protein n=1 Tax=Basidiobolus ranarum TaxID=34480 RepID=A0ABR2VKJ1_9FUNG
MCHSSFLLWMNAYGQGLTYCNRRVPSIRALIEAPRIKVSLIGKPAQKGSAYTSRNDIPWKSEFNESEWNTVWCQPTFFYSTIVYNCGFFSGPHLSRAGAIDGLFYGDYSMAASIPATQNGLVNDIQAVLTEVGMPESMKDVALCGLLNYTYIAQKSRYEDRVYEALRGKQLLPTMAVWESLDDMAIFSLIDGAFGKQLTEMMADSKLMYGPMVANVTHQCMDYGFDIGSGERANMFTTLCYKDGAVDYELGLRKLRAWMGYYAKENRWWDSDSIMLSWTFVWEWCNMRHTHAVNAHCFPREYTDSVLVPECIQLGEDRHELWKIPTVEISTSFGLLRVSALSAWAREKSQEFALIHDLLIAKCVNCWEAGECGCDLSQLRAELATAMLRYLKQGCWQDAQAGIWGLVIDFWLLYNMGDANFYVSMHAGGQDAHHDRVHGSEVPVWKWQ